MKESQQLDLLKNTELPCMIGFIRLMSYFHMDTVNSCISPYNFFFSFLLAQLYQSFISCISFYSLFIWHKHHQPQINCTDHKPQLFHLSPALNQLNCFCFLFNTVGKIDSARRIDGYKNPWSSTS